ncbi:MAG TPA: cyclase family protein [Steroidobacter sp.]
MSAGQEKRVQFDFEVEFLNGGSLKGQGFRLDIEGDDIDERTLGDSIVRDLRLLMVGRVQIFNKTIITEPHKRGLAQGRDIEGSRGRIVDLSHEIEHGMITYRGLPAPVIEDHLSHVASRAIYGEGTEFQIGRISMVANTGTYLDSPFHRCADGKDIAALDLERLANLEAVVVRVTGMSGRAIPREAFCACDVAGKAVLVHTGWDRHWRTTQYFDGHPFLTAEAAEYLRQEGAVLVGIDSLNIDDIGDPLRPVHTKLLTSGVTIVEHLRGLEQLPITGARFTAVPPKVCGMGSFPVRAFAVLP